MKMYSAKPSHQVLSLLLGLSLAACSGADEADVIDSSEADRAVNADAQPAPVAPAVDTEVSKYTKDREALFSFLNEGGYKDFPVHDERHPSVGPHDEVMVYWNKVAADSIVAGSAEHPAGSMIVKEQYKKDEKELYGWSVMIKTHDKGDAGKGWYWIEFLDRNDIANAVPKEEPGNGAPECAACHTLGKDLIRSALPKS